MFPLFGGSYSHLHILSIPISTVMSSASAGAPCLIFCSISMQFFCVVRNGSKALFMLKCQARG